MRSMPGRQTAGSGEGRPSGGAYWLRQTRQRHEDWFAFPLYDTVRHGEADHPGPPHPEAGLPVGWAPAGTGISYPSPHRDGFRAIATPGFEQEAIPKEHVTEYGLKYEAVNPTGWKGLKRRIQRSSADVLLVSETWIGEEAIARASQWAARRGWKSLWAPADRTDKGGVSSGTAVLARDWLGLRYPPEGRTSLARLPRLCRGGRRAGI